MKPHARCRPAGRRLGWTRIPPVVCGGNQSRLVAIDLMHCMLAMVCGGLQDIAPHRRVDPCDTCPSDHHQVVKKESVEYLRTWLGAEDVECVVFDLAM